MSDMTLDQLYQEHSQLLQEIEKTDDPIELVSDAEELVAAGRRMGERINAQQDRDYLQSILNFWASWLYRQTRRYPNIDLYPPALDAINVRAESAPAVPTPRYAAAMPAKPNDLLAPANEGYLMVQIAYPSHGATLKLNEAVSFMGVYRHLRPIYRLFFTSHDELGRIYVLDEGFSPAELPESGSWHSPQVFTPREAGLFRLGIALAITTEAREKLQNAYQAGRPIDQTPEGAIPFADLCRFFVK